MERFEYLIQVLSPSDGGTAAAAVMPGRGASTVPELVIVLKRQHDAEPGPTLPLRALQPTEA